MYFTVNQRSEIKHSICNELARNWVERNYPIPKEYFTSCSIPNCKNHPEVLNSKAVYNLINQHVRIWAEQSNCRQLQDAAKKVLIDKKQPNDSFDYFVKLVHDLTQIELRVRGIKYVELYRGTGHKLHSLRPLTPCSTNLTIAKQFGKRWDVQQQIYKLSIPAKFVASTYFTGYGCAEELEYVVLGVGSATKHFKEVTTNA